MPDSQDEIDFFAKYKDWVVSRSINCTDSTSPKEVGAYLSAVREDVATRAFLVLGVDTKVLDDYSEKFTKTVPKKDYNSLVSIYKSLGAPEADAEIEKAARGKEELKPFAKAYLFRTALRQLGLDWYIVKDSRIFSGKAAQKPSGSVPFSSEGISFMAKYKEWISIKKLSINANTKPEEIAAHLSSIRLAADRKTPQILGVNTDDLDVYASSVTENMRKSAANLEKIVNALCSPEAKKQIDSASSDASVRDAAVIYLFSKMLQNLKIDLEVSPDTLMDMFPGLKIPRPKGRMPGQKKKKA
jgi:hypothetical protein